MRTKATRLLSKTVFGVLQQKSLLSILRRDLVLNFDYDNKLAIAQVLAHKMLDLFEEYAPGPLDDGYNLNTGRGS